MPKFPVNRLFLMVSGPTSIPHEYVVYVVSIYTQYNIVIYLRWITESFLNSCKFHKVVTYVRCDTNTLSCTVHKLAICMYKALSEAVMKLFVDYNIIHTRCYSLFT